MRIRGRHSAKRRGVSAVVAELVLIAVCLISALMMGGFTYGLFGAYWPPAEVEAQSPSCTAQNGGEVCQLTLANQSPRSVSTSNQCALTVGGSRVAGSVVSGGQVPASGSLAGVECVVSGVSAPPGAQLHGELALMNYASVFFVTVTS